MRARGGGGGKGGLVAQFIYVSEGNAFTFGAGGGEELIFSHRVSHSSYKQADNGKSKGPTQNQKQS